MEPEEEPAREIKSIKQISDELRQAKEDFDYLLNCLPTPGLTAEEDLEKGSRTIEMLLKDLPSEQRLKEMLESPPADTVAFRQEVLGKYRGRPFPMQANTRQSRGLRRT
jgi:bacterioferritin (cytochrome b1)